MIFYYLYLLRFYCGDDKVRSLFINNSINIISKYENLSDIDIKKLRYGLDGLYSFVTKYFILIIFNIILNTLVEFLVLQVAYVLIRSMGFGLHAKTNIGCWILSIMMFTITPLLIKYFVFDKILLIIISLVSSIVISIFAPADTSKRPLIRKDKRLINKVIAILICLIYLGLIYLLNNFIVYCLTYALLLEALMINPLSYMLIGQSFNNYKKLHV